MSARWSPKSWTRPRSRAWREAHSAAPRIDFAKESARVLKRLYSSEPQPEMAYPPWALTARKFGWLTSRDFYAVPMVRTGRMTPGIRESLYREMPMLGLKPKTKNWGDP